jgi:hypothetical protein
MEVIYGRTLCKPENPQLFSIPAGNKVDRVFAQLADIALNFLKSWTMEPKSWNVQQIPTVKAASRPTYLHTFIERIPPTRRSTETTS